MVGIFHLIIRRLFFFFGWVYDERNEGLLRQKSSSSHRSFTGGNMIFDPEWDTSFEEPETASQEPEWWEVNDELSLAREVYPDGCSRDRAK